jgi:mitochondrial fission protein ELM1
MRILILSDGIPGHFNQSLGIVKILSEEIKIDYEIIESKLKYKLLRSFLMQLQKLLSMNFNLINAKIILGLFHKIDLTKFDLIVSTGKKVSYHSASLSLVSGIKNIHAGTIKNIDMKFYSAHITGTPNNKSPNNIVTTIPPTRFKPIENKINLENKLALFLIGGDGAGYSYDLNDWNMLTNNIEYIFDKDNIRPIIVTSRRTNKAHEQFLFNKLNHLADNDSIWFHKEKTKLNLEQLFIKASFIFVTEESATMTAEAISSGLPVTTLYPDNLNMKHNFLSHIRKYEKMRFIRRLNLSKNLASYNNDITISEAVIQIRDELKQNILEKINI